MRILLDECVNARIEPALAGHAVQTVSEAGWRSCEDAELVQRADGRYDVLVTIDRRLPLQQDIAGRRLAMVVVHLRDNRIESWLPWLSDLRRAIESASPGEVIHIGELSGRRS